MLQRQRKEFIRLELMELEKVQLNFAEHVKDLQNRISDKMKIVDSNLELTEDIWKRKDFKGEDGGGGITRYFAGNHIESAGVNTSLIHGEIDPNFAKNLKGDGTKLWATGISLIIHPRNPKVPTVHANFRMIVHGEQYWFGGGSDLTPFYPYEEDFEYFHQVLKDSYDKFGKYDEFKKNCDEYFVNKHRNNEMRGIGGTFFDHYYTGNIKSDLSFVKDVSESFIESYFPIFEKRMSENFSDEDVEFQLFRRSRYVEFNLVHDRGTLFGLKTNGRTKSILVSLPRRCSFHYDYEFNETQKKMTSYYSPRTWVK